MAIHAYTYNIHTLIFIIIAETEKTAVLEQGSLGLKTTPHAALNLYPVDLDAVSLLPRRHTVLHFHRRQKVSP